MNLTNIEQNLAAWNDQPLDTLHDIIVSFDYARYNKQGLPTGGFAVVFFDSVVDMPRGGGPEYSLGYTPSTQTSYCQLLGAPGLQSAILAVGFDRYGLFAAQTTQVNGLTGDFISNSFSVRAGINQSYNLIYTSPTISQEYSNLSEYTVDDYIEPNGSPIFKSVRVLLTNACTQVRIQLKQNADDLDFIEVASIHLPFKISSAIKVALTNTTTEPNTKLVLKNFNVAGYPGQSGTSAISGCYQHIVLKNYSVGTILPMSKEFLATNTDNDLLTYGTDTQKYALKNTNYFGSEYTIVGAKENYILTRNLNSPILSIYKYLGEKTTRVSTITLPGNVYSDVADIYDQNTLVACTTAMSGSIYFYKLIENTTDLSQLGTWQVYQTINLSNTLTLSAHTPVCCSVYANNLLVGAINTISEEPLVYAFQRNQQGAWTHLQTIYSPMTGVTLFGRKLVINDKDAVIAAPYAYKKDYLTLGQGEVYHYYLYSTDNQWGKVMDIGNFYKINTPAGNFGASLGLHNDTLVVGSPGENYVTSLDMTYEDLYNVGKVYVFNKTAGGIFSKALVLYPGDDHKTNNMFFGQAVNVYGNYVGVVATYTSDSAFSRLFVYDTRCGYTIPPAHFPVPDCALGLVDSRGYAITLSYDNTYMLSLSCQLIEEGALP